VVTVWFEELWAAPLALELSCDVKESGSLYRSEPFSGNCQLCIHSRASQHFLEPDNLLSCLQEPFTGPYPKPDQSIPCRTILSLQNPSLSTQLRLGIPSGLRPSGFSANNFSPSVSNIYGGIFLLFGCLAVVGHQAVCI
jgi:hypothetical protein